MNELPLLLNVAAYSAQVLCIVALGGLLSAVLRVNAPAVRHTYWRALVVVCIALPWIQGRQVPTTDATVVPESVFLLAPADGSAEVPASTPPGPAPALSPSWSRAVLFLLAAGAGLRLLWLGIGLIRLGRLRFAGQAAVLSSNDDELRAAIAPRTSIRHVPGLRQPVTFGVLRPVVLLPESLGTCDSEIRQAVLCHELHHARRGDWASVLVEELVLCALWFHPAAWWLVSRVQLSREEVVDELVVRTIGTRRTYIEALILFSEERGMAPAPAFARRRHLFRRIVLLSKETHMSMPRLLSSLCVWAAAVAAGVWYTSEAFPLSATATAPIAVEHASVAPVAQTQRTTERVPEASRPRPVAAPSPTMAEPLAQSIAPPAATQPAIPRQTVRIPVAAPPELTAINATGVVLIDLSVDAGGNVVNPRVAGYALSASNPARYRAVQEEPLPPVERVFPEEPAWQAAAQAISQAALNAARQFRYEPPSTEMPRVYAAVMVPSLDGLVLTSRGRPIIPPVDPSELARTGGPGIGAIAGVGANNPATVDRDLRALTQRAEETAQRVRDAAGNAAGQQPQGGAPGPSPAAIAAGTSSPTVAPPPPPPQTPRGATAPLRVGGNIPVPKKIKDVRPVYPAEAQDSKIQGIVIIEATIDIDGKVIGAKVLRSIPALDDAAVGAVKQWEFTPTLLNGLPVPIIMSVTVNFTLN